MSTGLDETCSPKDGRFTAALKCIADVHSQEVWNLHEENQHLRNQIIELRDHLRQIQARSICAKIDEPKMQSVAQSVAEDLAGWVGGGGIDGWRDDAEQQEDLAPLPALAGSWREAEPDPKPQVQDQHTSAGSELMKPAIRISSKPRKLSEVSEEGKPVEKVVSFVDDADGEVLASPNPPSSRWGSSNRFLSDLDVVVMASSHKVSVHQAAGDARESVITEVGAVPRDSVLTDASGTTDRGSCREGRRKKMSVQEILKSPEAEGARLIAQKTIEISDQQKSRFGGAFAFGRPFSKSVKRDTMVRHGGNYFSIIVHHWAFDVVMAMGILFNSILIGWSTQHLSHSSEETMPMVILGYLCSIFFFVELVLRIMSDGRTFFTSTESRWWNFFDAALVAFSVVEVVISVNGGSGGVGSSIKTIKMLRIMRLFRVFRFFKDLSLLALMVIDSMKSLMNALAMLLIITYVFAICFTVQASNWLQEHRSFEGSSRVDEHFGNLWKTLYALMQAMLSGISWGELTNALLLVDGFSFALFVFYVFFTMLAVLNIITGVFVDNAVETARSQRDYLVQKEIELKEMYVREMRKLFSQMDEDNSGTVSLDEVKEYFEDPHVQSYFTALGLDPQDSERLFSLLDDDSSGDVGVNEFIDGCLRLKGQARSIDIYALLLQSNRLENRLKDILEALPKAYRKSQAILPD